jgi:hypothetical protein
VVESLEASSAALTFDSAKARILRVVVREVNAAQSNEELPQQPPRRDSGHQREREEV